jgi:chitosanase
MPTYRFFLFALFIPSSLAFGDSSSLPLTPSQRHKIEEISSIFEVGTPDFQYAYIDDIDDGAGVGAGRLGFNTAAGDMLEVVQLYVQAKQTAGLSSPLAQYIPCLESIKTTPSYACLFPSVPLSVQQTADFKSGGMAKYDFAKACVEACDDPAMRKVQDDLVVENVYVPASAWAQRLGIRTAFGFGVIFDTVLQQGPDDNEANAMGGMVRRTRNTYAAAHPGHEDPSKGADEADWIRALLLQRRATLEYGFNDDDTEHATPTPYESYPRVDSLLQVWETKNWDLSQTIQFTYCGYPFTLTDSDAVKL